MDGCWILSPRTQWLRSQATCSFWLSATGDRLAAACLCAQMQVRGPWCLISLPCRLEALQLAASSSQCCIVAGCCIATKESARD